jgi:hypothetical protein
MQIQVISSEGEREFFKKLKVHTYNLALERLRQENQEFQSNLGYTWRPNLKKRKERMKG